MTRLLRSVFSNPIESGISAFRGVSDILQQRESLGMRRELLEREKAQSELTMQRERQSLEFGKKQQAEWERAIGREHATEENIDLVTKFLPAKMKWDEAKKTGAVPNFTEEERTSIINLSKKFPMFADKNTDEVMRALTYANNFHNKNQQKLMAGGSLNEANDPEYFKSLNVIHDFNRGEDKYGLSVEKDGVKKRLVGYIINPATKAVTPMLEITTPVKEGQVLKIKHPDSTEDSNAYVVPKGQTSITYRAPATLDHGPDPNAPVFQTPIDMIDAHLNTHLDYGAMLQAATSQVSPKETVRKLQARTENIEKSAEFQKGEEALDKLLKENPKATVNQQRNVYSKAAGASGILSQKEIDDRLKTIIPEKQPSAGVQEFREYQQMSADERAAFETFTKLKHPQTQAKDPMAAFKEWQKLSPSEKKRFGEYERALKPEKPETEPTAIKEFKEYEKMPPERQERFGKFKTLTKPTGEEKPLSVTEQKEMRTEALGRFTKLLPDDLEGKVREGILNRKNLDELISNLPDEQQSQAKDIVDRATELKKEDRKLTWNQAFNKAEKEIGKIEKALKPITQSVIDEIKKEIKNMKVKPKTPEDARALARTKARERGFDTEQRAAE